MTNEHIREGLRKLARARVIRRLQTGPVEHKTLDLRESEAASDLVSEGLAQYTNDNFVALTFAAAQRGTLE